MGNSLLVTLLTRYRWDKDISYSEVKVLIVEQIVTNIENMEKEEIEKRHIEKVYLESADLVKRIQRVTTDHGKEIGIRLKELRDLVAGDVLHMDDKNLIVIDVLSDDLLVIQPRSLKEMGTIAHQLGNRHLPARQPVAATRRPRPRFQRSSPGSGRRTPGSARPARGSRLPGNGSPADGGPRS